MIAAVKHLLPLGTLSVLLNHAILLSLPFSLVLVVRPISIGQLQGTQVRDVVRANWVCSKVAGVQGLQDTNISTCQFLTINTRKKVDIGNINVYS